MKKDLISLLLRIRGKSIKTGIPFNGSIVKNPLFFILIGLVILFFMGYLLISRQAKRIQIPQNAQADQVFMNPCKVKVDGVRYNAECGTLVVSENREDPKARLIALPVKRIHSPNPSPLEPIFYLAGGPGQSNMNFKAPTWLLENHDLVMVGYRGVDGSSRLDCPEISKALKGTGEDLLSDPSLDAISAAMQVCSSRLIAEGADLNGYTIPEVVRDMETARYALGYEKINLLSESYGTRVAQIHAAMYPDSILRSAMIGVNPPGHFVWNPDVVDSQITQYADLWKQQAGSAAPDLVKAMQKVNAEMPNHWLFAPIDAGKVKMVAFMMLFHRTTSPMVFDAYLSAAQGDASALAFMSLAYDMLMPNIMVWGEFFSIGYSADYEPDRNYRAELNPPNSIFGSPMSLLIWGSAGNWPTRLMPEEYRQIQPSSVRTLLVNGSADVSTPAQYATSELLPSLSNAQSLLLSEQGHTNDFWGFQPEARRLLLTSFFDTGTANDSLYQYLPMDFKPKMRFSVLAKVLLVVSVLLIGGLVWGIWYRIRQTKRAHHSTSKTQNNVPGGVK